MSLVTVAGSMSPVKGTVKRGCVEKPSSVFSTSTSAQSLGRTAQSGLGSATRRSVMLLPSKTVKRLLGERRAGGVGRVEAHADAAVGQDGRAGERKRNGCELAARKGERHAGVSLGCP